MALTLRDPFRGLRLRNEPFHDLLRDFFRGFDVAKATAELKNGVLNIRLPKSRQPKAHRAKVVRLTPRTRHLERCKDST